MELIEKLFYRKVNPSDFKKMYDIDVPKTGGGQTYLEAAGIPDGEITEFLSFAEITDSPLENETRSKYTINAHVLGNCDEKASFIEFAPRGSRANYRITRQNMKYKHPAWDIENGFPEPNKNENGKYTSEGNFEGIIDNLIITIIRTSYHKYYAGYINIPNMPSSWPTNIGLENIFVGERRGVITFKEKKPQFINSLSNPFGELTDCERKNDGDNLLLYGVPGCGKSHTIKTEYCDNPKYMERTVFHPDYSYSDFVGQILPTSEIDEQGGKHISYPFVPGPFTRILKKAENDIDNNYYLVIEEINRGNAPAIFGEIFQLLDRKNGKSVYGINNHDIAREVYGDGEHQIKLPSNLILLATMNTADQNVFTLDTAFKRRWKMRNIPNDLSKCEYAGKTICGTSVTWGAFVKTINSLIIEYNFNNIASEDKRLGAFFVDEDELDDEASFCDKILMYLWNDAFKFNNEKIFKPEFKTLESLINNFETEKLGVFLDSIVFDIASETTEKLLSVEEYLGKKRKEPISLYNELINEFDKQRLTYSLSATENYISIKAPNNRIAAEVHVQTNNVKLYIKEPTSETNKIGKKLPESYLWSKNYEITLSTLKDVKIVANAIVDSYNQVNDK